MDKLSQTIDVIFIRQGLMFFDKTLNILNKILTHPALMFSTLFAKIMFVLNFSSKNLILLTLVEEFD